MNLNIEINRIKTFKHKSQLLNKQESLFIASCNVITIDFFRVSIFNRDNGVIKSN